jgi:hypothetical protein
MKDNTELTEAGRQYATAYAAHYAGRDLPVALQLYLKVMASHFEHEGPPDARRVPLKSLAPKLST